MRLTLKSKNGQFDLRRQFSKSNLKLRESAICSKCTITFDLRLRFFWFKKDFG